MKQFNTTVIKAMATILALFLIASCSSNPTTSNNLGEISGTVTFVGQWPATGDIQVSAWASWPPAGPPAAASEVFTSGVNSQTYKIEGLSKGDYPVLTLGWRDPANPQGALVLGVYWANADSAGVDATGMPNVTPAAINISSDKLNWNNVDMKANLNVVP